MQRNIMISRAAGVLAAWVALPLAAHVPFLEEADYTPEKPYVVHDVDNSKSIHAQIGAPGDVDVYLIQIDRPTRIFTKTDIPWCEQYQSFGVTYALAGPGLPAPSLPLPVALPEGHGAIVVRAGDLGLRPDWVEPFSGRKMWLGPEYALNEAPPGSYQMIVWNEEGKAGDYIAVIGEAEIFNAPEIRQVVATSPKLKNGANLMVDCDPTVAEPVRPNFGRPQLTTRR